MSELENPIAIDQALGWVGDKLDDVTGTVAGRVEGVFVDSVSGEPAWLLIRIGLLGRRSVVPFEMAAGGAGHVWVPFTRDRIRSAPEVDPAVGLDPGREAEFCAHYEIAPDAGRSAALAGRDSAALSAFRACPRCRRSDLDRTIGLTQEQGSGMGKIVKASVHGNGDCLLYTSDAADE